MVRWKDCLQQMHQLIRRRTYLFGLFLGRGRLGLLGRFFLFLAAKRNPVIFKTQREQDGLVYHFGQSACNAMHPSITRAMVGPMASRTPFGENREPSQVPMFEKLFGFMLRTLSCSPWSYRLVSRKESTYMIDNKLLLVEENARTMSLWGASL